MRNAPSINVFKQNILKFIRPGPSNVYNVHNPTWLKLFTRLRLGLTHLRAHKFRHNFSDCPDDLCIFETNAESTNHFLLQCPLYSSERQTLMEKIRDVEISILDKMKITFFILYSLVVITLVTLKTFSYSLQLLNRFYRQKGLTFLFK